jgi:hypothetical protein
MIQRQHHEGERAPGLVCHSRKPGGGHRGRIERERGADQPLR